MELTGHCPMRFFEYSVVSNVGSKNKTKVSKRKKKVEPMDENSMDICLCHREYNHCIKNNENGEIPDIIPSADVEFLNFTEQFLVNKEGKEGGRGSNIKGQATTTTTTPTPDVVQAMGFEAS